MHVTAFAAIVGIIIEAAGSSDSSHKTLQQVSPDRATPHGMVREMTYDEIRGLEMSRGQECSDCNGNHYPDCLDIASGRSRDIDHNGFPDECEPEGAFVDSALLEFVAAGPIKVDIPWLTSPVVECVCDCPVAGRYRLKVLSDENRVRKTVFAGRLTTGRFVFYWIPPKYRDWPLNRRRCTAVLSSRRASIERDFTLHTAADFTIGFPLSAVHQRGDAAFRKRQRDSKQAAMDERKRHGANLHALVRASTDILLAQVCRASHELQVGTYLYSAPRDSVAARVNAALEE